MFPSNLVQHSLKTLERWVWRFRGQTLELFFGRLDSANRRRGQRRRNEKERFTSFKSSLPPPPLLLKMLERWKMWKGFILRLHEATSMISARGQISTEKSLSVRALFSFFSFFWHHLWIFFTKMFHFFGSELYCMSNWAPARRWTYYKFLFLMLQKEKKTSSD